MDALACSQCGQPPVRRADVGSSLRVFACEGCKHRGEVSKFDGRALGSWNLINDPDLPRHGCKAEAAPRFRLRDGLWGAHCSCGFNAAGYRTIEGARAGWARALR